MEDKNREKIEEFERISYYSVPISWACRLFGVVTVYLLAKLFIPDRSLAEVVDFGTKVMVPFFGISCMLFNLVVAFAEDGIRREDGLPDKNHGEIDSMKRIKKTCSICIYTGLIAVFSVLPYGLYIKTKAF